MCYIEWFSWRLGVGCRAIELKAPEKEVAMVQSTTESWRGLRVLVAEDNVLIGDFIRQILLEAGCNVVGPFVDLKEALEAIRLEQIDGALLDLELGGASVLPAAIALAERNIPFIVASGRAGTADLPPLLGAAPFLSKPFDAARLERFVHGAFSPRCAA